MAPKGFNYSLAVRKVCEDMSFRLSVFKNIQMDRVGISFSQTRSSLPYGVFASMTPLKFEGGKDTTTRRGITWQIPKILDAQGNPFLYVLTIYAPRFIDLSLQQKIETLVHELYHIGPQFDGDLRRFNGRCYAHGSSKKDYDKIVSRLAQEWLRREPAPEIWIFLKENFNTLRQKYGAVFGTKIKIPSLRRLDLNPGEGNARDIA